LGYGLRRADMPIAPVMIGLILGPSADQQLRRALAISDGDWSVLVTRPIAAMLLILAAAAALWPAVRARKKGSGRDRDRPV
jgi:putative tricarboxylic transport membrane protein